MIGFNPHTQRPSPNASVYFYVLIFLILTEASFFSFYGISRHYNYLTSIIDLGHMDQAVWGTLNGQPFLNTDVFNVAMSRLGFHFDPILALFVPFYMLAPSAIWLILAQAIALPLAGLPIYFLARQVIQSEQVAFLWASTCLLSPFILSAVSWDFHPASLAVPIIALAYLAVEKKQYTALLLSFVTVPLRGLFSLEQPRPGGDEAKRIVNDHDEAKAGAGTVSDSLKSGCLLLNFADLLMAVSLHRNLCIVDRIVKLSMLK